MRFTCGRVGAAVKASLRDAVPADLPAIAATHLASAREAFAHIGPVEQLEARDWAADLAAAEVALVAVAGDEVAGFIFTGGCEVQFFFTHPRVWGQGVGRMLLAAAEDALRAAGCTEAVLYTEERNERPLRVYAAAGWHPDGEAREREWLGVRIREPRLRKRL
jgi:GNAT superfamily N-acetyltransferase